MNADLHEHFLPRFVRAAHERMARSRVLIASGDADALARELHAGAGEAGMLDLAGMTLALREAEAAARKWLRGKTDEARLECERCLAVLGEELEKLGPPEG